MTDTITFWANGAATDNHGNMFADNGIACSESKTIIPSAEIKNVTAGSDLIGTIRTLARGVSPELPTEGKGISLGELASPLQAICHDYQQLKSRPAK